MHGIACAHRVAQGCCLLRTQRPQAARHDLLRCAAKVGGKRKAQRGTTGRGFGVAPAPDRSGQPCPCGSGQLYKDCCQPFHSGAVLADPENVLRSRYSAYVLADSDFLYRSYHPDSPELRRSAQQTQKEDRDFSRRIELLGLTIVPQGNQTVVYRSPAEAEISFEVRMRSRLQQGGPTTVRAERSTFVKEGDGWLYKVSQMQEREEGSSDAL